MAQPSLTPRSKRILVVEDDRDLLRMIQMMLRDLAEVETAVDGQDALERLRGDTKYDLIITDLMMPRLDGLSFVKALKRDTSLAKVPVVMLTAKDRPKEVIEGINAGARHYLTKPFKQEELVAKVKRALGQR
jgi:CheY-like chemotaxis protein